MLDAFIIEEIKRREQDREQKRPHLELPLPEPTHPHHQNEQDDDDEPQRGVIIIDYSIPPAAAEYGNDGA